jgi:hypothetical protein
MLFAEFGLDNQEIPYLASLGFHKRLLHQSYCKQQAQA